MVREFVPSEVPSSRVVTSRGLLLQEEKLRQDTSRNCYPLNHMIEELAVTPLVLSPRLRHLSCASMPLTPETNYRS